MEKVDLILPEKKDRSNIVVPMVSILEKLNLEGELIKKKRIV